MITDRNSVAYQAVERANDGLPTDCALKNSVALEVEPRLSNSNRFSGTSTKAWYRFANPQDAAIVVAKGWGNREIDGFNPACHELEWK